MCNRSSFLHAALQAPTLSAPATFGRPVHLRDSPALLTANCGSSPGPEETSPPRERPLNRPWASCRAGPVHCAGSRGLVINPLRTLAAFHPPQSFYCSCLPGPETQGPRHLLGHCNLYRVASVTGDCQSAGGLGIGPSSGRRPAVADPRGSSRVSVSQGDLHRG